MKPLKLKIGEFSQMNQVTVKTLRFYEEMELLVPAEIDPYSGYRYYYVEQMQTMGQIARLKKLGFGLEEIKQLFDSGNKVPDIAAVAAKLKQCQAEQAVLRQRECELDLYINHLKEIETMETLTIKSLPACIVASHRRIIHSYDDLFNLCPNIIAPEMTRLGCECDPVGYCYTIDHNGEYRENDIDIEYCEAVLSKKEDSELIQFKDIPEVPTAICYNHYGSYANFPQSWAKIYAYVQENGYKIADSPRFCYIDGIWNKEDMKDWLTQIQIPVEKV